MTACSNPRDRYNVTFFGLRPEEAMETIRLSMQAQNDEPDRKIEIERFAFVGHDHATPMTASTLLNPTNAPPEAQRPAVAAGLLLGVGHIDSGTIRLWAGLANAGDIDPIEMTHRVMDIYGKAFPNDVDTLIFWESIKSHIQSVGCDTSHADEAIRVIKEKHVAEMSSYPVLTTEELKYGDRVSANINGSFCSMREPGKEYVVKSLSIQEDETERTVGLVLIKLEGGTVISGTVQPNTLWNVITRAIRKETPEF